MLVVPGAELVVVGRGTRRGVSGSGAVVPGGELVVVGRWYQEGS